MASRPAKKQAAREEIEFSDPICLELHQLSQRANVLVMTEGYDFETSEDKATTAGKYAQRLNYLPTLLGEMLDLRIKLVVEEENKPEPEAEADETEEAATEGEENDDGEATDGE